MDTDDGCLWMPIISMVIEPMKRGRFCFWNTVLGVATAMNWNLSKKNTQYNISTVT